MLADHRDGLSSSGFSLILDSSVGLSAGIQSAEDWVSETLWVRILHSAEEYNLSPFDSKIACLCQSIEINSNKYVYRQSQVRMPNGSGVRWAECLLIIGTGCRVQVLAWSSIAQSVCQQAFSLLKIGFQRPSGFESCIQQRKTTCLLSIQISLACARASKLTTTNMYVCMHACMHACMHICMYIYILYDLNIACPCQSIEINNNKHVYRQSQVRKPNGSEVKWAEWSLIIGTGCRVQVFAWSSIAQSVCEWEFSLLANRCLMRLPGSNPAFSRGRQLVSFRFE